METKFEVPAWLDASEYPFGHHWRRVEAGSLHYVDEGAGAPIVFVHGTPTWSFEYRHVIKALARERRCIAFDHLGFGLSERPEGASYAPEDHAKRAVQFIEAMNLSSFDLVVHDFGGPIGLPILFRYQERVRRLIIFNTFMWPFDDDPVMSKRAKMVNGAFGRWLYRHMNASLRMIMPSAYGDKRKLTKKIHEQYLAVFQDKDARVKVLWALAKSMLNSSEFFRSLYAQRNLLQDRPTQLIWGMRDSAFQPKQLARWREIIPQAEVFELANAGHWPHEEEPSSVIDAMRSFLRDQR